MAADTAHPHAQRPWGSNALNRIWFRRKLDPRSAIQRKHILPMLADRAWHLVDCEGLFRGACMADLAAVPSVDRDECQAELIAAAAELADDVSEESSLIGYVILAAYSDGATRSAGYRPSTEDHKIGAVMWESWMGDLLKSQFAYQHSMSAAYDALYD